MDVRVGHADRAEQRQERLVEMDEAVALVVLELAVVAHVLRQEDPVGVAA